MTGEDAAARARHAARVVELAAAVVVAVHDDGPLEVLAAIRRALDVPAPGDVDPVVALVTVLAAALPPDGRLEDLLGWTRPLRALPNRAVPDSSSHDCDVHLLVGGRPVAEQVTPAARRDAVAELARRQLPKDAIAGRTGMTVRSVERLRARTAS